MKTNNPSQYQIGMIGLGTMGRNLLLNMADHGFGVAGYDKNEKQIVQLQLEGKGKPVKGFRELKTFVDHLKKPRRVMMLVPAGKIVDEVIADLIPLLDKGDLIIDGGNSHFSDTERRARELEQQGFYFFGMGISGGEEGARRGPSMMPGGDREAYQHVKQIFEKTAAQVKGEPCVTYLGPGASGHFVKMVHNGIEYALMQLIAETYELLKKGLDLKNTEIHALFKKWNEGRLQSFLVEITRDIFAFKAEGADHLLLDDIKDEAKAKGTGKWTSQAAMDLQVPVPTIDTAVSMRDLSKHKSLRSKLADFYPANEITKNTGDKREAYLVRLENALYFSVICAYAQGMHLLYQASQAYNYDLKLDQVAKIWRGGCIIRSGFLEDIFAAYQKANKLEHLFSDSHIQTLLQANIQSAREIVAGAILDGLHLPAFAASVSYFDACRTKNMPANLIQAQRDYFGAHTYELIGKEGVFHAQWTADSSS